MGAMLAQKGESKLMPIGYFSRMLSRFERLWSIAGIESLSIVGLLHGNRCSGILKCLYFWTTGQLGLYSRQTGSLVNEGQS